MGRKRFVIAFSVVAFVLASVIALLFQLGADEQVIQNLLPRIEQRLGVKITYRQASASLSGLSMKDVEVRPTTGDGLLVGIENLAISVRVGPLFLGDVDVTSVTADGLLVPIGQSIGGASFGDWQSMLNRTSKEMSQGGDPSSNGSRPEFHLASGEIVFEVGNFSGSFEGISGMAGDVGKANFEIDKYELKHLEQTLISGESGELLFDLDNKVADLRAGESEFEVNVEKSTLTQVLGDLEEAVSIVTGVGEGGPEQTGSGEKPDLQGISEITINGSATGATFKLTRKESGKELAIDGVSLNVTKRPGESFSVRAGGRLPGTDSPWTLSGIFTDEKPPRLIVELPNMSLDKIGHFAFDVDYLVWEGAFADSRLEVEVVKEKQEVLVSGTFAVSELTINHERLTKDPIENFNANADFQLVYDWNGDVIHLKRLFVSRKLAKATIKGDIQLGKRIFDLQLDIPTTPCSNVFGAFPTELRQRLGAVTLTGMFSLGLHLAVNEDSPDDSVVEANLNNQCRISGFGSVSEPGYFKGPFSYTAYTASGGDLRLVTGQGTDRWASIHRVSPYVIEAVLTTEDGKFWRHHGITLPEVSRAIAMNLRKDNLRHGASTITMQLAKNLFLTRERTVSRKLQELFFVWYLETYFEKEEILELYLNVIEFGPSIYGILDASEYYFGRHPEELNALESVFLIRLLPSPVPKHRYFLKGEASEKLIKSLHRVLARMLERKRIDRAEYSEATKQSLVFRREGDPSPVPRPPVRRFGANDLEDLEEDDLEDELEDDIGEEIEATENGGTP